MQISQLHIEYHKLVIKTQMQDIHTITSPKVFGDRNLRPHAHHQALKCPRCDSLNTKFCYYNNYNLSQPRHFCKSCRRYWTKGGVLRNVPVGGGCRKSKRKPPSKPPNSRSTTTVTSSSDDGRATGLKASNHCRRSSCADNVVACVAAGGGGFRVSEPGVTGLETLIESTTTSHNQIGEMMFPATDQIGGFMNPMSSTTAQADTLGLTGCHDVATAITTTTTSTTTTPTTATASFNQFVQSQTGVSDWGEDGILDPTVRIDDFLQNRGSNGGLAALDWQMGHGGTQQQSLLFDLPSSIDHQQGFWGHQTTSSHHHQQHHTHYDNHHHQQQQWSYSNNDQILFLP